MNQNNKKYDLIAVSRMLVEYQTSTYYIGIKVTATKYPSLIYDAHSSPIQCG